MSEQEFLPRAVILGEPAEAVHPSPASRSRRTANRALGVDLPTRGMLLVPGDGGGFRGVPDDNRSLILPDVTVSLQGRGYAVSVKGVGARSPLYAEPAEPAGPARRSLTEELWLGESPYGAQGEVPAARALEVTDLCDGPTLHGFHFCPVLEVNEFPPPVGERPYWYRRYRGAHVQEQRLVPSNVRLYHQSDVTLGQTTAAALSAFGVTTPEAIESFLASYLRSGTAALTLYARSLRRHPEGVAGLDYSDVWLDKDCVLAPDGTLHFADLEGLVWSVSRSAAEEATRLRDQFDRQFYEFLYGADLLLREGERLEGRVRSQAERRHAMVPRFEAALAGDPFTRCEVDRDSLSLAVRLPGGLGGEALLRLIDLR
jgi:hypothetical protein